MSFDPVTSLAFYGDPDVPDKCIDLSAPPSISAHTFIANDEFVYNSAAKTYLADSSYVRMEYHLHVLPWRRITEEGFSLSISEMCMDRVDAFHLTFDCEFSHTDLYQMATIRRIVFVDKQSGGGKPFSMTDLLYVGAERGIDAPFNPMAHSRFRMLEDKMFSLNCDKGSLTLSHSDIFGFPKPIYLHQNAIYVLFFSNGGALCPMVQFRSRIGFRPV